MKDRDLFYELSLDCLVEARFDGTLLGINPACEKRFGWSEAEVRNTDFSQYIHPEDRDAAMASFQKATQGGEILDFQCRQLTKSGEYRWMSWSVIAHRESGIVFCTGRDITRQRLFHELVLDHTPTYIGIKDHQGNIKYANRALREFYLRLGSYTKMPNVNQLFTEGLEEVQQADHEVFEKKIQVTHTHQLKGPNGYQETLHTHKLPLPSPESGDADILIVSTNVTELLAARKHTDEITHALNQSAVIAVTDPNGIIVDTNEKFCELSGYQKSELIGQDHRILNSGYHPKELFRELWLTVLAGKIWRGELRNRKKTGEYYWVDTTIVPIHDSNGRISQFISIRFDITARKQVEQELIASQQQLVSAARMAALGELAAGVAHEINNPLAVIQGNADQAIRAISESTDLPSLVTQLKERFQKIFRMSERISTIIKALRSFSHSGGNAPKAPISLKQIIEETQELCAATLRRSSISLKVENPPAVMLRCNAVQISEILVNLINNARDALQGTDSPWISIDFVNQGSRVQIRVTDSGKGIPPEVAKKLMQPFFTTKDVGKGTGLGLSISRGIAEQHGGKLFYDPTSSSTRFVLELPVSDVAAAPFPSGSKAA